jgi:hypothetical protein
MAIFRLPCVPFGLTAPLAKGLGKVSVQLELGTKSGHKKVVSTTYVSVFCLVYIVPKLTSIMMIPRSDSAAA